MLDALCREHPAITWYPERGGKAALAKAICGECLVRAECLAYADATEPDNSTTHGIAGGLAPAERILRRTSAAVA